MTWSELEAIARLRDAQDEAWRKDQDGAREGGMDRGPRTEAGKRLLAIDHEPKGPCFDSPACDCGQAIRAIEDEASALDAAWTACEATLPERGELLLSLDVDNPPDRRYEAETWYAPRHSLDDTGFPALIGSGPTPAAALRALAARLGGTPE